MNKQLLMSIIGLVVAFGSARVEASAQSVDGVKWVTEREDASLWANIRSDFHDQLQPDDPVKVAPVLAYSYKYIYRVAVYRDAAMVLVGHLETEDSKYPGYYSAFNYNVASHVRTPIAGTEVISLFKFVKFARLEKEFAQDIVFTWMTCTECEASQVLSAFHYYPDAHRWVLRGWETSKDIWWTTNDGPTIATDTAASDVVSFDCLQGFLERESTEIFGIRCREVDETDNGKRKTTDITLKYTFNQANSKLDLLKPGEDRTTMLTELCQHSPRNNLCRTSRVPSGQQ